MRSLNPALKLKDQCNMTESRHITLGVSVQEVAKPNTHGAGRKAFSKGQPGRPWILVLYFCRNLTEVGLPSLAWWSKKLVWAGAAAARRAAARRAGAAARASLLSQVWAPFPPAWMKKSKGEDGAMNPLSLRLWGVPWTLPPERSLNRFQRTVGPDLSFKPRPLSRAWMPAHFCLSSRSRGPDLAT